MRRVFITYFVDESISCTSLMFTGLTPTKSHLCVCVRVRPLSIQFLIHIVAICCHLLAVLLWKYPLDILQGSAMGLWCWNPLLNNNLAGIPTCHSQISVDSICERLTTNDRCLPAEILPNINHSVSTKAWCLEYLWPLQFSIAKSTKNCSERSNVNS